jgi:hypothetical protein
MCMLQISMQCYDKFFEVLPEDVETAELTVENIMAHILLDLFGEGTVESLIAWQRWWRLSCSQTKASLLRNRAANGTASLLGTLQLTRS